MVQLHIISKNIDQANEITTMLHEKDLVMNEYILKEVIGRYPNEKGHLSNSHDVLIVATTKALLFNPINKLLREKYRSDMPIIYAVPIVYMDEQQTEDLKNGTAKV
ncbi:hypothetical protein [uncultured Psychroserpens sp.]|uniref:hypothetical protein n=1 Tax=uncultured Psychroserpens sp. TaxID=255436 RepID=UPI00261EBC54|nr:hypothetical protein [uncultured Psychroserpens sp.]